VIGRGDDHGVHLFHLQDTAIVFELLWTCSDLPARKIEIWLMQIRNCYDFRVRAGQERVEDLIATVTESDEAQAHAVVRAENSRA